MTDFLLKVEQPKKFVFGKGIKKLAIPGAAWLILLIMAVGVVAVMSYMSKQTAVATIDPATTVVSVMPATIDGNAGDFYSWTTTIKNLANNQHKYTYIFEVEDTLGTIENEEIKLRMSYINGTLISESTTATLGNISITSEDETFETLETREFNVSIEFKPTADSSTYNLVQRTELGTFAWSS